MKASTKVLAFCFVGCHLPRPQGGVPGQGPVFGKRGVVGQMANFLASPSGRRLS